MNPVFVRPAPGAAVRAAASTGEITAAACLAHWCAGGALPSAAWVAGCATLMFGLSLGVQRGKVTWWSAVLGAGVGQLVVHLCLQGTAVHGHDNSALPMIVAHVVGALATVMVWTARRAVWDVLVRIRPVRPLVVAAVGASSRPASGLSGIEMWIAARHRGPPVGC